MKQLHRLQLLYKILQRQQQSLSELLEKLKKEKVDISRRQLERDLVDVEQFFVQNNEFLQINKIKRTHYYHILSKKENNQSSFKQEYQITNSNFYVATKTEHFYESTQLLIEAITYHKYIITELKNDLTGDNYTQTTEIIQFAPVKILHHRGTNYVIGFDSRNLKELSIYEIEQLEHIVVRKREFNFKLLSKRVETELDKRFGVTKNIDHKVYDIQLEFTNVLGAFIKKFHWHPSQKFYQKSINDTLMMHIRCGINRELLGWLCQWMYNVKIVSPAILQEYYDKTLSQMQSVSSKKQPFVYKNIFEPKE